MAAPNGNLRLFIDWEKRARNAVAHHYPTRNVTPEATAAWALKIRQQEYDDALREVIKQSAGAHACDQEIYNVPKRFTKRSKTPAQAYRDRWMTLREARTAWRVVRDELHNFEAEQDGRDPNGDLMANARTLAYTAKLLQEATDRITQLEHDFEECRKGRTKYQAPLGPDSEYSDSEYSDSDSDDFVTSDEDSDGNDEDVERSGDESESRGEESQSSYGDAEDSNEESKSDEEESRIGEEESESDEEEESAPVRSGFKIKLYLRKRTSNDDGEGASSKRSRTDGEANESAGRLRSSSTKGATSRDEDKNGDEGKEDSRGEDGDDGIDEIGNPVMGNDKDVEDEDEDEEEGFESDDSANYPLISLQDFDARWKKFDEIAKQSGRDIEGWDKQYKIVRSRARKLLRSEDWGIVPEITDNINVEAQLDDLEVEVGLAWQKMETRADIRKALRENELRATKEIGFGKTKDRSAIQGNFVFERELGHGDTATASLWVRKDSNETVVDRVVIKDMYRTDVQWNHSASFIGEIQDRISREAHMHQLASDQDSNNVCVVKYRESTAFQAKKMIRIYLEYCPLGEFKDVWIENWDSALKKSRESYPLISTAALWSIFECCAKAIHIMTFGCLPNEQEPEDWEPMVHRDIKSENVFMSLPNESRWRGTPMMKLGDFGFAGYVSEEELLKDLMGTPGYFSPEIADYKKRPPGCMVASAADIFTLGVVMVDLLTGAVGDANYDFGVNEDRYPNLDAWPDKKHYPHGLINLINHCVRKWPEDRIGVKDLCRRIEEEVKDIRQAKLSKDEDARFPWQSKVNEGMARQS